MLHNGTPNKKKHVDIINVSGDHYPPNHHSKYKDFELGGSHHFGTMAH